jgi:hypothetical protein
MAGKFVKKEKAGPIAELLDPIAYRDCVVTFIDILGRVIHAEITPP